MESLLAIFDRLKQEQEGITPAEYNKEDIYYNQLKLVGPPAQLHTHVVTTAVVSGPSSG